MKYPGAELDNFDKATIWRKYIFLLIKKFIRGSVLEVGAGIGSFTSNYKDIPSKLTLSEIDNNNLYIIKEKFSNENINFTNKVTKDLNEKFDTIMYLNVLEHIEKDKNEISQAFEKLNVNGYLIILVPAHNELYSNFDQSNFIFNATANQDVFVPQDAYWNLYLKGSGSKEIRGDLDTNDESEAPETNASSTKMISLFVSEIN